MTSQQNRKDQAVTNTKTASPVQITIFRKSKHSLARTVTVLAWCAISFLAHQGQGQAVRTTAPAVPPISLPGMAGRSALILKHLNAVITWYRNVGKQVPTVGMPTDIIYQNNARQLSMQVVQAAFQSAGADALLLSNTGAATADANAQDVTKLAPQLDSQIAQVKAQIEALGPQIASAPGKNLASLQEQRVRLQGDLELLTAEDAAVDQLVKFSSNGGGSGTSHLQQSIAQLQRTVPEVASTPTLAGTKTTQTPSSTSPAPSPVTQESSGLISEATTLFAEASTLHQIDQLMKQASDTEDLAKQLKAPLLTQIHQTLSLAASWAGTTAVVPPPAAGAEQTPATSQSADSAAPPATPAPTKQQFDQLTAQFKRLSAVAVPLSQEIIDLDQAQSTLAQWRQSVHQENHELLMKVLTKVFFITLSLGILALFSELWRRFIFRYVQDVRRRRQILILRRFVVYFLMGLVIILGFVSEFSSLATFAGFITAGLAVGLQTILLSVAAYFFLIGRYGIRVGDRISVSGITGDVIDVGLIRLYLMELAGTGNDIFPTGRIVVFPNSVLFQATVPLFKQIPGTEYAWHEVATILNANADAKMVQEKLLAAVNSVHDSYKADFERQHAASSRVLDIRIETPRPTTHLQFAAAGLELVVRYPVALGNVADADDQITQKIVGMLNTSGDLRSSITGSPQIRVAVKG
jgi:small-conductance mechanosensitive channel